MPAMRGVLGIPIMCIGCAFGDNSPPDARVRPDVIVIDSPALDLRTLSQTTSDALEAEKSIACPASASGTAANNYYRVFDLAALGITTDFTVTEVGFQVEHCNKFADDTGCPVTVRVGTYDGTPGDTLSTSAMTLLASNSNITVPEVIESMGVTPGGTVHAPIAATVPGGSKMFVEVDAPDGNTLYQFYMGANDDGESGFGYILAPKCFATVPTNISSVEDPDGGGPMPFKQVHLLLTVTGTYES
jgi:hypothetical protein